MTSRLVVLASGAGTNLQAILDATDDGRLDGEVVLVVVNHRGVGALSRAEAAGVATEYRPLAPYRLASGDDRGQREAYDSDLANLVDAHQPHLVVLCGWMHLFTTSFLDRFPGRVINLHPALPGEFPGAHAIDDAWAAHVGHGLQFTGVTVHLVPDEGVDVGPALATRKVPILAHDTRESLEQRIHEVEHSLLVAAIVDYSESG